MTYYPWQFMVSLRSWWWPWGSWWFWWSRDDQNTTQGIRRRWIEEGREAGGCSEDDRQTEVYGSQQRSGPGIATVKDCVHNFSETKTGNLNFRWTTLLLQAKNWTRKWCQSWATWRYLDWIQVATIWLFSHNNMTKVVLSLFLKFLESKSANFEFCSQPRITSVWQPTTKRKDYHIYTGRDVELGRKSEGCKLLSKTTNGRRHQAGVPSHDQVFFPPQVTRRDLFFIDTVIQDWISWMRTKCLLFFFVDMTLNLSQPQITRNRLCHFPRGSWKRTEVWGKSPPGPHHAWSCPAPARRSPSPTRWPTSRWRRSPTTISPSVLSSSPHFQWRCERSLPAQKIGFNINLSGLLWSWHRWEDSPQWRRKVTILYFFFINVISKRLFDSLRTLIANLIYHIF